MALDSSLGPHGQRPAPPRNTRTAGALLTGEFTFHHYDPVPFTYPIDWSVDPHDNTWRWALHNFQYLYDLVNTAETDAAIVHRKQVALDIIRDWWLANRDGEPSPYSWRGHCIGLRAQLIGYLNPPASDWLMDLVSRHAEELLRDDTYEHGHNHGLDQDLGLLALAGVVPNSQWIEVAISRLAKSASSMVDHQGATAEQSVGYSYYVYAQLRQVEKAISNHERKLPPEILAYRNIPHFLNQATQPNSVYTPIGDTGTYKAFDLGYETEWCATGGLRGQIPADTHREFERGWIFGRSGWGTRRPFSDETFYSVRFGPGKGDDHGHVDNTSLTYFASRTPLIIDAGFAGYGDKGAHHYEKHERGHNMVIIHCAAGRNYRHGHPTSLLRTSKTPHHATYLLEDFPYEGVRRRRSITYIHDMEALFVYDTLMTDGCIQAVQRWHVNPQAVSVDTPDSDTYVAEVGATTLQIQQGLPIDYARTIAGEMDPMDGWAAVSPGKREHAPVLEFSRSAINPRFATLISTGNCSIATGSQDIFIHREGVPHTLIQPDAGGDVRAELICPRS